MLFHDGDLEGVLPPLLLLVGFEPDYDECLRAYEAQTSEGEPRILDRKVAYKEQLKDVEHGEHHGHHRLPYHSHSVVLLVVHERDVVLDYPIGDEKVHEGE